MKVAILGAGTMGHGIAHVAAKARYDVALFDARAEQLPKAVAAIASELDAGVAKGKVSPQDRDAALARLRTTTVLKDALNGAGLVVEAVPEDLDLKRRVFRDAEGVVAPDALLATNTSSLSVGKIAEGLRHAERVVGLHFFNPVHIMKLLEIVRGPETSDASIAKAQEIAQALGKDAIVVRDAPGFATSRLGVAFGLEAIRMVEERVASPQDIDKAMELGYNHPMGPLKLTDVVGLDVRLAIAEHLARELGPRFEPPQLLRQMVAAGKLGKKAGHGFYHW